MPAYPSGDAGIVCPREPFPPHFPLVARFALLQFHPPTSRKALRSACRTSPMCPAACRTSRRGPRRCRRVEGAAHFAEARAAQRRGWRFSLSHCVGARASGGVPFGLCGGPCSASPGGGSSCVSAGCPCVRFCFLWRVLLVSRCAPRRRHGVSATRDARWGARRRPRAETKKWRLGDARWGARNGVSATRDGAQDEGRAPRRRKWRLGDARWGARRRPRGGIAAIPWEGGRRAGRTRPATAHHSTCMASICRGREIRSKILNRSLKGSRPSTGGRPRVCVAKISPALPVRSFVRPCFTSELGTGGGGVRSAWLKNRRTGSRELRFAPPPAARRHRGPRSQRHLRPDLRRAAGPLVSCHATRAQHKPATAEEPPAKAELKRPGPSGRRGCEAYLSRIGRGPMA